jgi:hypothetical protein
MDTRNAEIRDLDRLAIGRQQKVLRLYVAVNYAVLMGMAEASAYLFDVSQCGIECRPTRSYQALQIAPGQIFQDQIMKDRSRQVAGRSMSDAANDIRVANAVECYRFVLKILDKGSLQVRVEVILEKDIQGLDHDILVRRLRRGKDIAGQNDLGITSPPELLANVVSLVQSAVV